MEQVTIWEQYSGWIIFGVIIAALSFMGWLFSVSADKAQLKRRNDQLYKENQRFRYAVGQWEVYSNTLRHEEHQRKRKWESYAKTLQDEENQLKKKQTLFKRLFQERTRNYPVAGQIWSDLINLAELERARTLRYKRRPALKAAEEIKSVKQEKRSLVKELTYWKYKAQNYETIYPWLAEELEQDIQDEVEVEIYYTVYTEQEREDPVAQFISPEDYRKLSISERNQLALDRYWQRGRKTKWMIGKMYERYVGYLYENDGWDVTYFGIHKRFEDLGRDLIARKGKSIHVVQCKHWSRFKTIYENHIFQLFGTSYSFQKEHRDKTVVPVFFCSTSLSETATEFAGRLGIKVQQRHPFQIYPAIKCNITPKGEKIYHLPFDQQYDTAKIHTRKGEFYAETVEDAEKAGYRRAFRWSGQQSS